jgi:hypothetical protein
VVCAPRAPLVEARGWPNVLDVVVACKIGAVAGLLSVEMTLSVRCRVAKHVCAVHVIVGDVKAV